MLQDNQTSDEQDITYEKQELKDLVRNERKILGVCWNRQKVGLRVVNSQNDAIIIIIQLFISIYAPPVMFTTKNIHYVVFYEKPSQDQELPRDVETILVKIYNNLTKIAVPRSLCG